MIERKPEYYDKFICIADRCPYTCCMEWKIGMDPVTEAKWKNMSIPPATSKRSGYSGNLSSLVKKEDDGSCMKLNGCRKCHLLNEEGLCDVVLTYGEENISSTCHTFPRERHEYEGYCEKTLAAGCPAVLDLLWQNGFAVRRSDTDEQYRGDCADDMLVRLRDYFIELVDDDRSIETSLKMMFYIGLDCLEKEDAGRLPDESLLVELEKTILGLDNDPDDTFNEQNELFLDICDSYRKKDIYKDVIDELAHLAEEYEENESLAQDRCEFERLYSDIIDDKLKNLVREEIYSTLLLPQGDIYSMVMKIQWLAITYAVIRQGMFLYQRLHNKLEYDDIRRIIVVIIRMTGYSEQDIEEYLENSFEEVIWDWGYMALIMGQRMLEEQRD